MAASWRVPLLLVQRGDHLGCPGERGRAQDVGRAALMARRAGGPADAVEPGFTDGAAAGKVRRSGVEPVRRDPPARRSRKARTACGPRRRGSRRRPRRCRCGGAARAGRRPPRSGRRIRGPARRGARIGRISPVTLDAPVTARRLTSPCFEFGPEGCRWCLDGVGRHDAAVRDALPRQQVGVVLDVQVEDFPGVVVVHHGQAARQQVQRIGGVPREDYGVVRAAANEVADDVPGIFVDGGADLRGVAGAAVHAGVERQDLVEVGRDDGQRRCGRPVVEVGVADVAALDQRGLDFSAGHCRQRPSGSGKAVVEQPGAGGWRRRLQLSWDLAVKGPLVTGIRACRVRSGPAWSSPGAPHREWRVAGQQTGVSALALVTC